MSSKRPMWFLGLACWSLSCGGAATEHETLGDRAYAALQYDDALVEYRLALAQRAEEPDLLAKAAASALHSGSLADAAVAYLVLAEGGNEDRFAEAADGLERVARAALEAGDTDALTAALGGLRQAAPGRALGSLAQQLAREIGDGPPSEDVLSVLAYAAAAAPDARVLDSLMYTYAAVLRQLGRCEEAVPVFEGLARRQREPAVRESARAGLGYCAMLVAGQFHGDLQLPLSAEEWYRRTIRGAEGTVYERRAYLGLGDVLFARGDYPGAAEAYESVLFEAAPGDSLADVAYQRLNMLGQAGTVIP
jgi:tetratricopeptide (TPR) repeat protein